MLTITMVEEGAKNSNYNICIFCCGECEEESEAHDGKHGIAKFVNAIEKYVEINSTTGCDKELYIGSKTCSTCGDILKYFCELYHQMKSLQLKMEWKLEILIRKMEAGNTSSKLRKLKRCLGDETLITQNNVIAGGDTVLRGRHTSFRTVMDFRSNLISKCFDKISRSKPKIILEKTPDFLDILNQENKRLDKTVAPLDCLDSVRKEREDNEYTHELLAAAPLLEHPTNYAEGLGDDDHFLNGDFLGSNEENALAEKHYPNKTTCISNDTAPPTANTEEEEISYEASSSNSDYEPTSSHCESLDSISNSTAKQYNNKKYKFACTLCTKRFNFKTNLTRHLKQDHQNRNASFSSLEVPVTVQNAAATKFQSKKFSTKTAPRSNTKKIRSYSYSCSFCSSTYRTETLLHNHLNKYHQDEIVKSGGSQSLVPKTSHQLSCPICGNTFTIKSSVIKHLRKMHELSLEEAKACYQNFDQRQQPVDMKVDEKTREKVDTKPYKCNQCHQSFGWKSALMKHKLRFHSRKITSSNNTSHIIKKQVQTCNVCSTSFKFQKSLDYHMAKYHGDDEKKQEVLENIDSEEKASTSFSCPVSSCTEDFQSQDDLDNHKKLHGSFKCEFCEVVKEYAPDLAIHETEKHAINLVDSCDNPNPDRTISPQSTETKGKGYNCPRCKFSAVKKDNYIRHHLDTHLNLTLWHVSCSICKLRLKSSFGLENLKHFKSHHHVADMSPSDVKRCDLCSAFFRKAVQLIRHKDIIHGINTKCTCPLCGKVCSFAVNLKIHMKYHHDDESLDLPLACDMPNCKKRFPNQTIFDWHKLNFPHPKITQQVKIVNCPECNKECQGEGGLKTHMRSHKRTDYVCEQCGASFKKKHILRLHYEFHKGPENWEFQCQECGKKCATNHRLQEHMHVHSDEKRFKCKACGQGYKCRQKLRTHVNTVHAHEGFQDIARKKTKPKYISRREAK